MVQGSFFGSGKFDARLGSVLESLASHASVQDGKRMLFTLSPQPSALLFQGTNALVVRWYSR